jgi:perosamine synthetase
VTLSRFGEDALRNVAQALAGDLDGRRGRGTFNRRLEEGFQALLDISHALTFSSATAALITGLRAVGVGYGDEVIVDPLVKFGAVAALHLGAVPVFADVDARAFVIDPEEIERRITPRTRAVVCTALYGLPARMEAIVELGHARGVAVLEDCAQAMLARRRGRWAGTWGDVGVFSFQATKHLSTGEGGLLVTADDAIWRAGQAIREHGWQADPNADGQPYLGQNYRMAELVAAVGVAQLATVAEVVEYHERVARLFTRAIEDIVWLEPQYRDSETTRHAYWVWSARMLDPVRGARVLSRLRPHGFKLGCYPKGPAYRRSPLQRMDRLAVCPRAEALAASVLTLRVRRTTPLAVYEDAAAVLRGAARTA